MTKMLIDRSTVEQALEALDDAMQMLLPKSQSDKARRSAYALRAALAEEALQRLTDVQQEIEAAMAEPEPCQYPDCVDNGPDGKCTRWLLAECSMSEDYKRYRPAKPLPPIGKASTDVGVPVYVVKKTEPVQEPDDKAASIRWQLCLLAQTEEFSDDVRNQIGRGVWLIDRLCAALAEAGYTRRPTLWEMAEEPVQEQEQEPVQEGCDHCNHPLYAGIKCRVCGRVTEPVEPVAYSVGRTLHWHKGMGVNDAQLYLAPPPQRKPLTDEGVRAIMRSLGWDGEAPSDLLFARAVEAAHGIKEGT